MSITNAFKYGALGFAADIFTGGLSGGLGSRIGFLYGLFQPDAPAMDRAYQPERATQNQSCRSFAGFPMADELFGARRSQPAPAPQQSSGGPSWGQIGLAALGAATILPAVSRMLYFGAPLYVPSLWSTPWSPAGLIPSLWSRGVISNWGWSAGWLI